MEETTVTIGDTDVRIEETDDGFEAVEVDSGEVPFDSVVRSRHMSTDWSEGPARDVYEALAASDVTLGEDVKRLGRDNAVEVNSIGVCLHMAKGVTVDDFMSMVGHELRDNGLGVYYVRGKPDRGNMKIWVARGENLQA